MYYNYIKIIISIGFKIYLLIATEGLNYEKCT